MGHLAPDEINKNGKKFRKTLEKLIHIDAGQFQEIMPYYAYDDVNQFFINDSSIGFGYELGTFSGANEELVNKLMSFINTVLPDDEKTYVKIMRWCNNKVGKQLDDIKRETSAAGGVFETLAQNADDYYRYAALEGFPNQVKQPICLRDNKLFAFFSKDLGNKKIEELFEELNKLRDDVESDFKNNVNFSFRRIEVKEFISTIRDILNPEYDNLYYQDATDYSDINPIKEQIKGANFEMMVNKKDIDIAVDQSHGERTETKVTSFYINRYPNKFGLWQNADCFANVWKTNQTITGTYIFSVTFCVKSYEASKQMAQSKFLHYDKLANSAMGRLIPSIRKAAQEWDVIRQEVEDDKRKLVYAQPVLVLFSPKEKARDQVSQAISCFGSNGFQLVAAQYIQLPLFLSIFPFLEAEGLWTDLKIFQMVRRMRLSEVVSLLPVIGDFIVAKSGVVMPTFRHQFSAFLQFVETLLVDNKNMALAASSGAGKSFFIQAITLAVLCMTGRVWIIDKGDSYRKLCNILGGTYIDATTLSLNPFSNVERIENEAPSIRDLIAVMASPSGELTDVQLAHLLTAVNHAWSKKEKKANIDTVVEELQALNITEKDIRISDIVVLLKKYTTSGQYGKYFNYPSILNRNHNFTVLELGGFEQNDELLRPVLFALILTIQEQMFNTPRHISKMCVIDEAWALLQGENQQAKRFIETGYRTARKHGGSFVTITQGLRDFFRSPESEALWDNSAIKIIMKQQDLSALKITRNGQEVLSAQDQLVVREFPAAKNGYSSILIKAGDYTSFNRLFVDPFKRILLSTEPKQFQAVENFLNQKFTVEQAVTQVAQQYYGDELTMIQKRLSKLKGANNVT